MSPQRMEQTAASAADLESAPGSRFVHSGEHQPKPGVHNGSLPRVSEDHGGIPPSCSSIAGLLDPRARSTVK